MTAPKLPGLQRHKTQHGKIVWYVRVARGPRHPLKLSPNDPCFVEEYGKVFALAATGVAVPEKHKGPVSGTIIWLWTQYNKSSSWASLALSTRRQRENIMKHVLANIGQAPIAEITRKVVKAGLEKRSKQPSAANNYLATMRHLFAWAIDAEYVKASPCDGLDHIDRPDTDGFPAWNDDDEARFIARWPLGTRQYLAYEVHARTGLRRGDAVRLGRQHFTADIIHIVSAEKTARN